MYLHFVHSCHKQKTKEANMLRLAFPHNMITADCASGLIRPENASFSHTHMNTQNLSDSTVWVQGFVAL